jgi:hypothetical protein
MQLLKYKVLVILTGNINIGELIFTSTRQGDLVKDVFSLELHAKSECVV